MTLNAGGEFCVFTCLSVLTLPVGSCYKRYKSAQVSWFVAFVMVAYAWVWYMEGHVGVHGVHFLYLMTTYI